ncbi:MAG: 4Fe-4S binding protein [Armatimonadetes bacterium]|nr:4Fe-4S binding protein [Armatimonadota bacterium]
MPEQQCPCLTIAVAAGKGGTGKTLVSTSLAQALSTLYPGQVQFLDCDVEEPNAHLLLRPEISAQDPVTVLVPEVDLNVCTRCGRCADACQNHAIAVIRQAVVTFPELCSGCGACAYVCRAGAIREVPRQVGTVHLGRTADGLEFVAGELNVGDQKATPVTHAVKRHTRRDRLSIIDAPPGTACPMQETVDDSDFCLLVTEPTPFGLSDLRLAVETCRGLGVPCGVLVNRAGSGFDGVDEYCEAEGLPLVGRIEQDRAIAEAYSRGHGLLAARPETGDLLLAVFARIEKLIVQEVSQDD